MTIAVDFDGTLFTNNFPEVGEPIWKNIEYVKQLQQNGHNLILWTCRVGEALAKAVSACKGVGLVFDTVNANIPERIDFFQTDPRKVGADVYLDDRALRPSELELLLKHQEDIWENM